MADRFDRRELLATYEDWVALIPHIQHCFLSLWPSKEIRADIDVDRLVVFWKFGRLGLIYFERGKVAFSSTARLRLKELDADVPDLDYHESLFDVRGWRSDEAWRSDLPLRIKAFWLQAREEAELYWNGLAKSSGLFEDRG